MDKDRTLYQPAHDGRAPHDSPYDLEVLCASWNPLVAGVAHLGEDARDPGRERAIGDADSFLSCFYRAQQG